MSLKEVRRDKGHGFIMEGRICMIRCFKCGKENYGPSVSSGTCSHCGFNPNKLENNRARARLKLK